MHLLSTIYLRSAYVSTNAVYCYACASTKLFIAVHLQALGPCVVICIVLPPMDSLVLALLPLMTVTTI